MRYKKRITFVLALTFMFSPLFFFGDSVQAREPEIKPVPIIMYHYVTAKPSRLGKFAISPSEFEQDLAYLQAEGYETVTMADLIAFVGKGRKLPEKPIMLTFDDGDANIERVILPLLERYDMRAVASIVGDFTDTCTEEVRAGTRAPNLTWDQVKILVDSGRVEIQNHTYSMHKGSGVRQRSGEPDAQYQSRLTADLSKLQDKIKEVADWEPTALAYPFGIISPLSDKIARDMGLQASFSCYHRVSRIERGNPDCLFSLGRYVRPHGPQSKSFFEKILAGEQEKENCA